jgi:lipopolysaccharide transport system ATP-binding protein
MSDTVINVENLSKCYQIGHRHDSRDALRHRLEDAVRHPGRWLRERQQQRAGMQEEFWALKDVSFAVRQGDAVGVIGRNGAGKSTLLKLLSQITEPTRGRIRILGRVASLLEVGTGFHQELTGRENIFLNGAILGMPRAEIRRKFDEIVAFSEVEKFLDTPVKRYSSGMYVRLAFSVAAHLDPEILVVDEVLAVGDAEFQKKCLGKMDEAAHSGRTILFVSHNVGAIRRLCQRSILLEGGKLVHAGTTEEVLTKYLKTSDTGGGQRVWETGEAPHHDHRLNLRALRVVTTEAGVTDRVDIRRPVRVEIDYELTQELPLFRLALRFMSADGTIAFTTSDSTAADFDRKQRTAGRYTARCEVPGGLLNEGYYSLTLSADIPFQQALFVEESALGFFVEQTGGVNSRYAEKWPGAVCPALDWQLTKLDGRT